jgi:hypothetical protein
MDSFPFSDDCYINHKELYFDRLRKAIQQNSIDTVVITSATETTLFPEWIQEVVEAVRLLVRQIEIQTHNYGWTETFGGKVDVLAYSYDRIPTIPRSYMIRSVVRDVFIWNKNLTAQAVIDYFTSHYRVVDQCTVKQMVNNSYGTQKVNDYIKSVYAPITPEDVALLTAAGIRVDPHCDVSEGRYIIYRTNGDLYQRWSDTVSLKIKE